MFSNGQPQHEKPLLSSAQKIGRLRTPKIGTVGCSREPFDEGVAVGVAIRGAREPDPQAIGDLAGFDPRRARCFRLSHFWGGLPATGLSTPQMARRNSAKRARTYSSDLGRTQADATRRGVLVAARDVFKRLGYARATIEAVAAAAHVSVPTVYAGFGSKAGLLSAVVADGGSDADIRRLVAKAMAEAIPKT